MWDHAWDPPQRATAAPQDTAGRSCRVRQAIACTLELLYSKDSKQGFYMACYQIPGTMRYFTRFAYAVKAFSPYLSLS